MIESSLVFDPQLPCHVQTIPRLIRGKKGRWFKCNIIFVNMSAASLDGPVHSATFHLNPVVILTSMCILLLPSGNVNFCLNQYPV